MRADFEERTRKRSELNSMNYLDSIEYDGGREEGVNLDFPSLGEAPRMSSNGQSNPTRSRFSGAVKFGGRSASQFPSIPAAHPQQNQHQQQFQQQQQPSYQRSSTPQQIIPQSRPSVRLTLRPPLLLPTLTTGIHLSSLYSKYRSSFLALGARRNKCLSQAAECWRRGDGAGAKKWSREAQDWNRQVLIEGNDAARMIMNERGKAMREAVLSDVDTIDRKERGKELAGGIVLGVVAKENLNGGERLSSEERTEGIFLSFSLLDLY
jgi:hypothetical protein